VSAQEHGGGRQLLRQRLAACAASRHEREDRERAQVLPGLACHEPILPRRHLARQINPFCIVQLAIVQNTVVTQIGGSRVLRGRAAVTVCNASRAAPA